MSDHSPHAVRAFREWLRTRYRTAGALRSAWNDPQVDFRTAAVPTQAERQRRRNDRLFRDPGTEMPVIDWYLFYNDLIPDTIDAFARAAKEACRGRMLVGTFNCYMFEFGGDPEFGHNALTRLARSRHLDFVAVTASYFNREAGSGADYARAPITSLALHNKLWYHDNDTVSFRYAVMNAGNPDRVTVARYRRELGVTETPQETIWQYRRGAGFVLGYGIYQSFFDLHGGYFDDPRLMAEIRRLNALLGGANHFDRTSVAEILVVSDESSCSYATFESGFLRQTLRSAQVQLAKLGAPHDSILVNDLALADLPRYKLILFLNCFHLTDAQRDVIRRQVLNRGRTVVWCHAQGLFNGASASIEAMRKLTGIDLAQTEQLDPVRARIRLSEEGSQLWLAPTTPPQVIGHEHVCAPLFFVDDPRATPLEHLDGSSAPWRRHQPFWAARANRHSIVSVAFRDSHPLVRSMRNRTLAKVLPLGLVVRKCQQDLGILRKASFLPVNNFRECLHSAPNPVPRQRSDDKYAGIPVRPECRSSVLPRDGTCGRPDRSDLYPPTMEYCEGRADARAPVMYLRQHPED